MPVNRYYSEVPLIPEGEILLTEQEFHHLAHVNRTKEGEAVELVDGKGNLATASVVNVRKKEALLKIDALAASPPESFRIVLAQAVPRLSRLDTILEKGTELGVTEFILFPGERSEIKRLEDKQLARMKQLTISAMKQCGRLYLPALTKRPPLKGWEHQDIPAFFGDLEQHAPDLISAWQHNPPKEGICVVIGPESGFSESEEIKLRALGCKGIKLHHNILRTDTAAIAALSIVSLLSSRS